MERPNLYEYCKVCHICLESDAEHLCYAMMPEEKRKQLHGDKCSLAERDDEVPKELILPRGLGHGGIEVRA